MSRPVVSAAADELYSALLPVATEDEARGWPLLLYCESLSRGLQKVDDVVRDDAGGVPGWGRLFDETTVPDDWLPWIGQFVGVQLSSATAAGQRAEITARTAWARGTKAGLVAALQLKLSGTKQVIVYERYSLPIAANAAYQIAIRVKTSEATLTLADFTAYAKTLLPAGIILDFAFVTGFSWDEITAQGRTWDQIAAVPRTWDTLQTNGAV